MLLGVHLVASADDKVLRIGTGGTAGTYFIIGSLIAQGLNSQIKEFDDTKSALSHHIVLPQRSSGSVSNVQEIKNKLLESALVQADIAHSAYKGIGVCAENTCANSIRAIGSLYLESVHLVASLDSGIASMDDLLGARVSVDEIGSGTQLNVTELLKNFELDESNVNLVYLKPLDAIERMSSGQLDAFFMVAGYPVSSVKQLLQENKATIVPIEGASMEKFLELYPFFTVDEIPAEIYGNTEPVATIGVAAQWVVDSSVDDDLVYEMTRCLWSDYSLDLLAQGHPKGAEVDLDSALDGLSIPVHGGAKRYYMDMGMEIPDL